MEDEEKQPQEQPTVTLGLSLGGTLDIGEFAPQGNATLIDPNVAAALREFSERGVTFDRNAPPIEISPNHDFDERGMRGWVENKTGAVDQFEDGLEDWALGRGSNPFEGADWSDILTGLALGALEDEIPGEQRDPFANRHGLRDDDPLQRR